MEIKLNDSIIEVPEGATLQDALDQKGIPADGIATALNGTVVPRTLRGETILKPNDSIIIIKAFYGG